MIPMKTTLFWWHLERDLNTVCHTYMGQADFSGKGNQYSQILYFSSNNNNNIYPLFHVKSMKDIIFSLYKILRLREKIFWWENSVSGIFGTRDCLRRRDSVTRPQFKSCFRPFFLMCEIFKPYLPQRFVERNNEIKHTKCIELFPWQTANCWPFLSFFLFCNPGSDVPVLGDRLSKHGRCSCILEMPSCYSVNHHSE